MIAFEFFDSLQIFDHHVDLSCFLCTPNSHLFDRVLVSSVFQHPDDDRLGLVRFEGTFVFRIGFSDLLLCNHLSANKSRVARIEEFKNNIRNPGAT